MKIHFGHLAIVVLLIGSATATFSQDKVDPSIEIDRFFGTASFTAIPFEKFVEKIVDAKPIKIEGITVKRRLHRFREPIFVSTEYCGFFDTSKAASPFYGEDVFYRVSAFISYEISERVFAYEVNYESFDTETRSEIGAAAPGFYTDETGDGAFTLTCVEGFKLDHLPEWVKALPEVKE